MSTIYWDTDTGVEVEEVEAGSLAETLKAITPHIIGNRVELDTEGSGLFVDGDWKDAPPARVSVVSLSWAESNADGSSEIISVALPFDQGRIGGKPGRWSEELDGYEVMPHTQKCIEFRDLMKPDVMDCVCAPWNLSVADWAALCVWLKGRRLVMHNVKHDLHQMNAGLRTVPDSGVDLSEQTVWDTMLAQGIIAPLERSGLKPTAERLFGESSRDEERVMKEVLKKNGVGLTWRYDLVAWDTIGPYAAQDTKLTHMLFDWQQLQIEMGQVGHVEIGLIASELELCKTLFRMECRRVGFDIERMREQTKLLTEAAADLAASLPFQPVNVNTAKAYFFGELGITPIKVTDVCTVCTFNREKGQQRKNTKKPLCKSARGSTDPFKGDHTWAASLDGEVAARLAADGVPFADVWVQLAQIESALSKWYKAWPYKAVKTPEGWRLMTNFRQGRIESDRKGMTSGGAISGRLSAERVQAQGFPDDYKIPSFITPPKKLLQAKPGHELWELDISNAEVKVAAWLMQSPTLAKACATGNVHSANCRMMFGELLTATHPGGVNSDLETHPDWGMYRKIAKTTVLGLFFGAGIRTLKAQIEKATNKDFSEAKVKQFRDMTLAVIPEWKGVSNRMQRKADKSKGGVGYIELVNGRKRWFGWAEHTHKALNSATQGGVAETCKMWMLMVEERFPGILVSQVHDSIWIEPHKSVVSLIVEEVRRMGEKLFIDTFSTTEIPIQFNIDAKQLA